MRGTALRHPYTWKLSPAAVLAREAHQFAPRNPYWPKDGDGDRLFGNELVALAMLVEQHRDEFEQTLAGLADTPRLDDVRRKKRAGGGRGGL